MRVASSSNWLAARAANVVRRTVFLAAVGSGACAAAVAALVAVTRQPRMPRVQAESAGPLLSVDTALLAAALTAGQRRLAAADSGLDAVRARTRAAPPPAPVDSLDRIRVARRDSLSNELAGLQALVTTAQTAPLPSSYRALAVAPALASSNEVKAMLDSLGEVERERDAMATGGGSDPIFVALTSRLTDLGRAIQSKAEDRIRQLRDQLTGIATAAAERPSAVPAPADTARWIAERDSARAFLETARGDLQRMRERAAAEAEARRVASTSAATSHSPAMLGAALVFLVVLSFAAGLADEIRRPRIADAVDAERATGIRVLATVHARPRAPDRARRATDRSLALVDPSNEAFSASYLAIVGNAVSTIGLTVASDVPEVAAAVALNVAAIAAEEARSTLIIDAGDRPGLSVLMGAGDTRGTTDVARGAAEWTDVVASVPVGRGRSVDIVPSGQGTSDPDAICAAIRKDAVRLARHYDALIVLTTPERAASGVAAAMILPDVVLCVRAGHTLVASAAAQVEALELSGAKVLGLIVWSAPLPRGIPRKRQRHEAARQRSTSSGLGDSLVGART